MNQLFAITRRELQAYFRSPVALIFLGTFLFVVLFSFFWVDTFFRRNIADVRPLFHWLPILLVFLVAALTMRLWSEEQRMGTLEILLTLPVKIWRLVLGKFLAGLILVAIALALTICLPITASSLGNLDWGPVFGGYIGALLLAGAYLAIGLCISSSTDNPIVALIGTAVACGLLYLLGSDAIASFAGNRGAEILRAIGTGSRFESIQRGVIDVRDLLYYGSLIVGFLFLNIVLLEAKRWSVGERTKVSRSNFKLAAVLVCANLLVLNIGLQPVHSARLDLTERGEYSISPVTKNLLRGLDAPLQIRGYFSAKTHPLLAPLVPRIRDMIEEYGAVGGDKIKTEFVDPQTNPAVEKEVNEDYGIKSFPFQFSDRHQAELVNAYFTVLIKYGDKYEKLSFNDLIEVKVTGMNDIEVKLRNLEYDLTRSIKKVVYGFQPIESLFQRLPAPVTLTAYVTEKALPENMKSIPERLQKIATDLQQRSNGKFTYKLVDPSDNEALRKELFEKHGFRPMATSLFADQAFYLHLLLTSGDKTQRLPLSPEMSEADLKNEVTASLRRFAPGFLKTIGFMTTVPPQPPQQMMGQQRPPQTRAHELLKNKLGETYTMQEVDLKSGRVPGDVDVLMVVGPENIDDKQRFAIDQFLMRGGAVIVAMGQYQMEPAPTGGIGVRKVESGMDKLLAAWGVTIKPEMVLDTQNDSFPVPRTRDVGGFSVQQVQLMPYPFFIDVRGNGLTDGNPIVAGLPSVVLQWASPLEIANKPGVKSTVLLSSSANSWVQSDANIQPNFDRYPEKGFASSGKTEARPLAVALTGKFESAFKDQPNPLLTGDNKDKNTAAGVTKGDNTAGVIKQSPDGARLIVVGSTEFLNDLVLNLSRQTGSERFTNNLQFSENLIDWSVADVDLLSIRSRGTFARTLVPLEDAARSRWELLNYGFVILALGGIVGWSWLRRRQIQPLQLVNAEVQS